MRRQHYHELIDVPQKTNVAHHTACVGYFVVGARVTGCAPMQQSYDRECGLLHNSSSTKGTTWHATKKK